MRTESEMCPLKIQFNGESIKSDTADIQNTGERKAGAITAAKFL